MARGGIYKSEVIRARTKLLAQGINPSIDAIRAELGTGSKTTIHRYLKEIEEAEGASTGRKVSVSDAIQNMVETLAARLHEEAEARITEAAERNKAILAQKDGELAVMRQEVEALKGTLANSQAALSDKTTRLEESANSLRSETLERTRFQQQVIDLQDRLAEEAALRHSLEEKHQQAREALDHFRQAAKEQRDQEQRRHEQQVQYLQSELKTLNQNLSQKLHEVMQANQENVRLTTELARVESALNTARSDLAQAKSFKEDLDAARENESILQRRAVEQKSALEELKTKNQVLEEKVAEVAEKMRQQEIELATAKAANATQEELAAQFKKLVETMGANSSRTKSGRERA
jgi:DNA repair exonuclease SbcCD ATPase subunit